MRFHGATVEGELWFFGSTIYELGKLTLVDCVIDNSHISGHFLIVGRLVIDNTRVAGVVHPGVYACAGANVRGEENGPWKVFMGGTAEE